MGITDSMKPRTKMHEIAKKDRFRHIFFGLGGIGGRFSALPQFGMIPLTVMGGDVKKFLQSTEAKVQGCASCVPAELNSVALLDLLQSMLAKAGRAKVAVTAFPA